MTRKSSALPPDPAAGNNGRAAARRPDAPNEPPAPLASAPFVWPLLMASSMSHATAAMLRWYGGVLAGATDVASDPPPAPDFATPNRVMLELPTMRLRDFSNGGSGQPALICAPYALHGATIADFAPEHSIAGALRAALPRICLTEWRSAGPDMRFFSIDTYLADLAIAIEEIGPPVDLIGLCQGGWMAIVFAARFPNKVRRLVLAGAPIDVRAAPSALMDIVDDLPFGAFENLVRLGEGRVLGQYALKLWGAEERANDPERVLQIRADDRPDRMDELKRRFERWYACTVDLPGRYYLEVVQRLFEQNQIAAGQFVALGRRIDLKAVRMPLYLLAAEDDEVTAPGQLFAAARLVGTPERHVRTQVASGGHLGLFMGAQTISGAWRDIAGWLASDLDLALAS